MKTLHVLLAVLVVALAACGGGSNTDTAELLTAESQITDKFGQETATFVVGDDIVITARILNRENITKVITFGPPLISHLIYSEDGARLVFDPLYGIASPSALVDTTIEPFGEISSVLNWNGVDNTGSQVFPGKYEVRINIFAIERTDDNVLQHTESIVIELL